MYRRNGLKGALLLAGATMTLPAWAYLTSAGVGFTLGAGRSLAEVGEKCEVEYIVDIGLTKKSVSLRRQCPAEEREMDEVRYPDDFGAVYAGPGRYIWHIRINEKEVESGEVTLKRPDTSK